MVHAERVLLRRDVVAQREVELVNAVHTAGNRRDRVVRLAVRFGKDERSFIRIAAPLFEHARGELNQALRLLRAQTQNGNRPVQNARFDVLKSANRAMLLDARPRHRECVVAALIVVVRQNRAADDRQIGVRAEEVMRELTDKIEQLAERALIDLHRHVLAAEHDAVLIVVDIGRILEKPIRSVDCERHSAVVLARRVVHAPRVADVLLAEHTRRVSGRFHFLRRRDRLRVLFGL